MIAERREPFLRLMREVWGSSMSEGEYDWWFSRNPVGPGLVSVVEEEGRVLGVLGMGFFRTRLLGEVRVVPFAVQGATHPAARGRGIFSDLEHAHERVAAERGHVAALAFANPDSARIFAQRVGWRELTRARIWAHPKRLRRTGHGRLGDGVAPSFDERHAVLDPPGANGIVKDAQYLTWRYADSPRAYRLVDGGSGYAVVGYAVHRGFAAGLVCELAGSGRRALLRRCVDAVDADVVIAFVNRGEEAAYAAAGFVPTPETVRFIGKSLGDIELPERRSAWRFTLGDLDFF